MSLLDAHGNPVNPGPAQLTLPKGTERPTTRVLIAIPTRDELKAGFALDLVALVGATTKNRPDIELAIVMEPGTLIVGQRIDLARLAIGTDADYILWLDSDMRFPKNALVKLMAHGKDIVAANYVRRQIPPKPVAFLDDYDDTVLLYTTPESTGLQEVVGVGMGVMLTTVNVFRQLSEPWFGLHWNVGKKAYGGEDTWFARTAREHGFKVFVDHDLSQHVEHLGEFKYRNDMAQPETE